MGMLLGARAAAVCFFSEPKQMLLFAKQRCTFFRKISSLLPSAGGALVGEGCVSFMHAVSTYCATGHKGATESDRPEVTWFGLGAAHSTSNTPHRGVE